MKYIPSDWSPTNQFALWKTAEERFWKKVNKTDSCWLWKGAISKKGWGTFAPKRGKGTMAHRFCLKISGIHIPYGKQVTHTCGIRSCVNPNHMRFIFPCEKRNTICNKNFTATHCKHGHPFSNDNTVFSTTYIGTVSRACKVCIKKRNDERCLRIKVPKRNNYHPQPPFDWHDLLWKINPSIDDRDEKNYDLIMKFLPSLKIQYQHAIIHRYGLFGNSSKELKDIGNLVGLGKGGVEKRLLMALKYLRQGFLTALEDGLGDEAT